MVIVGVDPGYGRCGFAVVARATRGAETLLHSECFVTDAHDPFSTRLLALSDAFRALLTTHTPDLVALEKVYFTSNQKTAMRVAEVRGALSLIAHEHRVPIAEYNPNEVKVAVAGSGRASKKQVMAMVPRLIRITKDIRLDDEFDAIAIALTASAARPA